MSSNEISPCLKPDNKDSLCSKCVRNRPSEKGENPLIYLLDKKQPFTSICDGYVAKNQGVLF